MPAKFTLIKDKTGKFRFSLLAANGAVVATSAAYGTKASALNGLASVRKNALVALLDDSTVAKPAAKPSVRSTAKAAAKSSVKAAAKPVAKPAVRKATVAKPAVRKATVAKPVARKAAVKPADRKATVAKPVAR